MLHQPRFSRRHLRRFAARVDLDPVSFAGLEPVTYDPRHILRLHRLPRGTVPGVKPRMIDIIHILDHAMPDAELIERPRKLDTRLPRA